MYSFENHDILQSYLNTSSCADFWQTKFIVNKCCIASDVDIYSTLYHHFVGILYILHSHFAIYMLDRLLRTIANLDNELSWSHGPLLQ